jgi:glycosyltransferase involved in cell wall biosynthesis
MAVDWPIYTRRPLLYALAENAARFGTTVVALNRPLCPLSTPLKKPSRLAELIGKPALKQLADRLYLYSPRYVIHDHLAAAVPGLESLNLAVLRRSYAHLQDRLGIAEPCPIAWFNYPQQGYVARLLAGSFSVFELYDNLCDIAGQTSARVDRAEEKLRGQVDLLLTTSAKLHDKYARHYKHSYLFGNGLSRHSYERLASDEPDRITEIEKIPSPRIGYAGVISDRLDWQLITALASMQPDWQFVFAGRIAPGTRLPNSEKYGNLHFVGAFEPDRVPAVLKSFDIGLMPYRDNAFFQCLNPLKFYEMAAAGLPSAASNIPELEQFPRDLVRVLPNRAELWRDNLRELIAADRTRVRQLGREIAGRFIWEDMAAALLTRISELIQSHRSNPLSLAD